MQKSRKQRYTENLFPKAKIAFAHVKKLFELFPQHCLTFL